MRNIHLCRSLLFLGCLMLLILQGRVEAQSLTAPTANFSESTVYPVFPTNDRIYYFRGNPGEKNGSLRAESLGSVVNFSWEKYNPLTNSFDPVSQENAASSILSGLADGGYRVRFTENGINYALRAWIFNSSLQLSPSVSESNCASFKLEVSIIAPSFSYYDLNSGQPVFLAQNFRYSWLKDGIEISSVQNPLISPPPPKNTDYRVQVTDRSRSTYFAAITYQSIVAKALFSWISDQKPDPQFTYPEAPAAIEFQNQSQNADPDKYEWFLYKDKADIEQLSSFAGKKDSFLITLNAENPKYTYQNSGRYKVKLVAAKESPNFTCRDTFYMKDYIVVDTSLVKVAPVFTPNGDGINDQLIIKTRSLETLDFQIFNRWGNSVHHFSRKGYIPEDSELAAWDGKIGDKLASPGVYFYVVSAKGRDGKYRTKKGFIQMIW